ncbi:hypothetical protein Cch01nite_09490 [Cellulomonas chitinilytica]|uniref:Restriction endonuclease type IV Mrr domain-containing protein n=1 Tax=Cellulomonas chitinilytica TaxID=398759 RepID=A0A919TY52_9CELL|nr:restriction endonuclease [Cellulomonas chitinilytica]GIG20225.1 hypothetical protein Cch01nite_09490 [Cellulomonas chitinilytica]
MAPLSTRDFPPPFAVARPDTAEELAAVYLRWAGFLDATRTPTGADAGLDVDSRETLAQVKFKVGTTGRPDLQRLFGAAAHAPERQLCFFSLAQYSDGAKSYAMQHGIALFGYDRAGRVWPCNGHAGELHRAAVAAHAEEDRRERERETARRAQAAEAERLARADAARRQAALDARARRRAAAKRARQDSRARWRAETARAIHHWWSRRRDARAAALAARPSRPSGPRAVEQRAPVRVRGRAMLAVGLAVAVCGVLFGALGAVVEIGDLLVPGGQPVRAVLGGLVFYWLVLGVALLGGALLLARSARGRRAPRDRSPRAGTPDARAVPPPAFLPTQRRPRPTTTPSGPYGRPWTPESGARRADARGPGPASATTEVA